jgi:hypothetical protein
MPPAPVTGAELIARWAQRDAEYAKQTPAMDPGLAEVIRQGRMREANQLPDVKERGQLFARAKTWAPPVHADFGSLLDWLHD